ncbi:MAG: hypothetical protein P4M05_21750 [Bradyrhizobium sp.]|nr:hypothetical protein [Bradyrhizobium sp.]
MATSKMAPTDLDHYDALTTFRDRFCGIHCAIKGIDIASTADRDGLLQLAADLATNLTQLCAAFAAERGIATTRKASA